MLTQTLDARLAARPIEVDSCAACRVLWFDQWESTNLAPRGVLALFQYIGGATGAPSTALASTFN